MPYFLTLAGEIVQLPQLPVLMRFTVLHHVVYMDLYKSVLVWMHHLVYLH